MKNLFALAFVAVTMTLVSCGGASETASAVDSVSTVIEASADSSVIAPVDTISAIVDSTASAVVK